MDRRNLVKGLGFGAVLGLLGSVGDAQTSDDTVYELRIYHLNDGKEAAILERMRTKEAKIFERLGMHGIGFWVPTDEPLAGHTLIYILRHKSRDAAKDSWAKFKADPEWLAAKAESEKDGPLVAKAESTFMKLTDFSPKI